MAQTPLTAGEASVFYTVRLSASMMDRLSALAEKNDRTRAAEVRRAIRKLLDKEGDNDGR